MKIFTLALLFSLSLIAQGASPRLIDKIVGVINQKSFSLSDIKRIQKTFEGRKMIAPMIYDNVKNTKHGVIKHLFEIYIIQTELQKMGYQVTDKRVQDQIKNTLKRIGLTKRELIGQLKQSGLSFQEYEELIRESMEFSLFNQKIISPLVIVSEQEIKSFHWKNTGKRKSTAAIEYKLKDYMIEKTVSLSQARQVRKKIQIALKKKSNYQKNIEIIDFGTIKSESLDKKISEKLQNVQKGGLSEPILINGYYHIFYVVHRKESESDRYQNSKMNIANYIYQEKSRNVMDSYFEQKIEDDYFTKYL